MSRDSYLIRAQPLVTEPSLTPFISASKAQQSEHAAPTGGWGGVGPQTPRSPGPNNLSLEPAQNLPCQTTGRKRQANVAVSVTFQSSLVVAGGSDQNAHQEMGFRALELEPVIWTWFGSKADTERSKFLQLKSQKEHVLLFCCLEIFPNKTSVSCCLLILWVRSNMATSTREIFTRFTSISGGCPMTEGLAVQTPLLSCLTLCPRARH